jgi:hypothetical protein
MVLVHLTIIMVRFRKGTSHVLDVCLPIHETTRSSHWVGVPIVTLNACTPDREEVMYVNKLRRGSFCMRENNGMK